MNMKYILSKVYIYRPLPGKNLSLFGYPGAFVRLMVFNKRLELKL